MKKNLLYVAILIILSSCTVTRQYYSFEYYGTDSIKSNSNFKYVAYNVKGKAKSTIKISQWRRMKQEMATEGLIATAKEQLPKLKDNQAFANLSIDVLRTEQGEPVGGGGINITSITLEVVISADIIEYID